MNLLVGVSAPDENTFVIEMSEPYYPMLTELGCIRPFAMISPNCMINGSTKDGVNGHIGTGPYVLTDFVTDEYAVFERNENYWGNAPAIRKITVKVIPDNQTRIMALESGEIDLIFGKNMIDADAISQYLDSDKFTVGLSDPTSTRHIVMNTTHEILGDPAVRKALQHATDRQTISDGIFYGLEQPADTLYATTVPYCNVGLKPYEYSTETAAQLLDEAGWVLGSDKLRAKDGKQLALDLLYNSDSVTEKTIAEYLQSEYLKLGISMTIHGEEEQSYRDNMKAGNFDMVFNICWGMPYDPQSSLAAMRAPVYGDYAAQQGLEDKAEIDEAITKILTSTDETERQELYKSVLTNLHEDPQALEHVIRKVAEAFKGDLIVTENGIATADDTRCVAFVRQALDGVQHCIADDIPVKGYFYWSLIDNFEWQLGFAMQFGLIAVNRETMERTAKPSLGMLGSYAEK